MNEVEVHIRSIITIEPGWRMLFANTEYLRGFKDDDTYEPPDDAELYWEEPIVGLALVEKNHPNWDEPEEKVYPLIRDDLAFDAFGAYSYDPDNAFWTLAPGEHPTHEKRRLAAIRHLRNEVVIQRVRAQRSGG